MRILFISHFFWPETGAASKRITGLAKHLAKQKNQVGVVTCMPNYPTGIVNKNYKRKFLLNEEYEEIKIYRSWVYASPKKSSIRRLLNYFSIILTSLFQIPRLLGKYDVIITSSPPLFIGIAGYIISRVCRIPLVFDIRDIWPEVAVEIGELKKNSILYRLMKGLEEFIYRKASMITVVTEGKKQALMNRGIRSEKIKLISNGFDEEFLQYKIESNIMKELGLHDKFVVLYAGIIGKAQGLDMILDVAKNLANEEIIHFLLVGDGVEKEKLITEAKSHNLSNVTFLPEQPHEKILSYLIGSSVSVVPLKSSQLNDSIPSKLYEAIGAGCPVILCAQGDSRDLLNKAGCGIAIDPEDRKGLTHAIKLIEKNPIEYKKACVEGQQFIIRNYTRKEIALKLAEELNNYFELSGEKIIKIKGRKIGV